MFKERSIILICIVITWCCTLCGCLRTSAGHVPKERLLAGHRIAKIHKEAPNDKMNSSFSASELIFQDKAGFYWLAGVLGIYRYDEKRDLWTTFREGELKEALKWTAAICQGPDNNIWIISSLDAAIRYFDGERWHLGKEILPPDVVNNIHTMFTGVDGNLWLLSGRKLVVYNGRQWTAIIIPDSIISAYSTMPTRHPSDEISNALEQLERITQTKEISGRNERQDTKNKINTATDIYIAAGLQDRDGHVWLGTQKAIFEFEGKSQQWKVHVLPEQLIEVRRIYEDRTGRLWFADTHGNVSVYHKANNRWISYNLNDLVLQRKGEIIDSSFYIYSMYQDRLGQMMFGTEFGLVIFAEKEKKWNLLTSENSDLLADSVMCIREDHSGRIWLGTGNGVVVLEQ